MTGKILILDDEEEYLLSLRNFLHEFGYAVCVSLSCEQALEAMRKEKPDLVLFDYKLPDFDGDVFLKRAKEISPSTKFMLVTAWNDSVVLEKFKNMGVIDAVLKPISLEKLLATIRGIIKKETPA